METGNCPGGLFLFPDPTTREMIPEHLLDRYQVMPLGRKEGKLILGMVHPDDEVAHDDVRLLTGLDVESLPLTKQQQRELLLGGSVSLGATVSKIEVKARVVGNFAWIQVRQTVSNPYEFPVPVRLLYPRLDRSAVHSFEVQEADAKREATVFPLPEAELDDGLLDDVRFGGFLTFTRGDTPTVVLANLPSKKPITVQVGYLQLLELGQGKKTFHFPLGNRPAAVPGFAPETQLNIDLVIEHPGQAAPKLTGPYKPQVAFDDGVIRAEVCTTLGNFDRDFCLHIHDEEKTLLYSDGQHFLLTINVGWQHLRNLRMVDRGLNYLEDSLSADPLPDVLPGQVLLVSGKHLGSGALDLCGETEEGDWCCRILPEQVDNPALALWWARERVGRSGAPSAGLGQRYQLLTPEVCFYLRHNPEPPVPALLKRWPQLARTAGTPEEAPAQRIADQVLAEAVHLDATHIHLEPEPNRLRVRYRVDGSLFDAGPPLQQVSPRVLDVLRSRAGLEQSEGRPQSASFELRMRGQDYLLGLNLVPTNHGEKGLVQIHSKQPPPELENLGLSFLQIRRIRQRMRASTGAVVVSGVPTHGLQMLFRSLVQEIAADPSRSVISTTRSCEDVKGVVTTRGRDPQGCDADVVVAGELSPHWSTRSLLSLVVGLVFAPTRSSVQTWLKLNGLGPVAIHIHCLSLRKTCLHCQGRGCAECHQSGRKGCVYLYETEDEELGLAQQALQYIRGGVVTRQEAERVLPHGLALG